MIALDTETTGLDLYHDAKPFFVTICNEDGTQQWWEWDVDPLTRQPEIPKSDLLEIYEVAAGSYIANDVVMHNGKFDVAALASVYEDFGKYWPWERTYDTIFAAHLLASNRRKDLTSLAVDWLGVDIEPYEKRLEVAVKECRNLIQRKTGGYRDWLIAKEGLEGMPSAGEKAWKADYWLPRAYAKERGLIAEHPYWTVLSDYANVDSAITLQLWQVLKAEIDKRELNSHYATRNKLAGIVYGMESRGLTISKPKTDELIERYEQESAEAGDKCISIAASYGHTLELPKNGMNKSLRTLCFDVMKLPPVRNPKSKTDIPSLDKKVAIPHYMDTLPARSRELKFIETLVFKRSRDTAVSFLEAYKRFGVAASTCLWCGLNHSGGPECCEGGPFDEWLRLHPHVNPTGTDTLRWSSSNPNSQNVSKQDRDGMVSLRYCFGPAPGREWWTCDAKNIELRIPAYECGEQLLIELFENENEPPYYGSEHLLCFSTVYPEIWEAELKAVGFDKVGPHCKKKYASTNYQWCKNGDFAVGYGAVDRADGMGTADRTYRRKGAHKLLKQRFSKKEELNRKWISYAETHGYVETLPFRSINPKQGYPLVCPRNNWGRILATIPLNYHVSGTAMLWMALAMIRCDEQLTEWRRDHRFDGFIAAQIHDELLFDFPKRADPRTNPKQSNLGRMRALQKLMANGGDDICIATPVSLEYHPVSWSEGITL